MQRRIESSTSRTAQMTCLSRASSFMETNGYYKSDDFIAPLLLPGIFKVLLHFSLIRKIFSKIIGPKGIYEYVIVRTRYIDAVFKQALEEQFDQIVIFGAGFDTRALRFKNAIQKTRIFELDAAITQQAKIHQYHKCHLSIPQKVSFVAIDFDKETLSDKFDEAGFYKNQRSLFIMEGLLMYLQPESVNELFQTIQNYAGKRSWIIFDYVYASVIRNEGIYYGEDEIIKTVTVSGEQWHFGIEKGELGKFLDKYAFKVVNQKDALQLEKTYFGTSDGTPITRINGTHCLVIAEKI